MDPLIFIFSLSNEMKNSLKKLLFQLLGIQLFWTFRSLYLAISDVKMMMIMDEKADLSVVYFSPPDPPMIFPNCRKRKTKTLVNKNTIHLTVKINIFSTTNVQVLKKGINTATH